MFNSFNQLLITLSALDSIFIVLALYDYSWVRAFGVSSRLFVYLFPFLIYPFNNISFCASIFVTVALAYERYIAVCRPLHYRDLTARHSVRKRTLSYVIPCLVLSVLLNVPKFLESRFVWRTHNRTFVDPETNETMFRNETVLGVGVSSLREDPDYIRFYINWTRLLTTGLAPMAALVFFNWNIFRGIRMTHERTRRRNKQKAGEMNLAAILLCIVVVFTICHSPRVMLNVHEFFMLDDMLRCGARFTPPVWYLCVTSFNHWLLIANASFNFIIYCSVGTGFKEVVAALGRRASDRCSCCVRCLNAVGVDPTKCLGTGGSSSNSEDEFVTTAVTATNVVVGNNASSSAVATTSLKNGKAPAEEVTTTVAQVEMTKLAGGEEGGENGGATGEEAPAVTPLVNGGAAPAAAVVEAAAAAAARREEPTEV